MLSGDGVGAIWQFPKPSVAEAIAAASLFAQPGATSPSARTPSRQPALLRPDDNGCRVLPPARVTTACAHGRPAEFSANWAAAPPIKG